MTLLDLRRILIVGVSLCIANFSICCVAAADSPIDVPYSPPATDSLGNRWVINSSSIGQTGGQTGNQPVYTDVADLFINNSKPIFTPGHARTQADGEIVFDAMPGNGYTVTRRIRISDNGSIVRVADVITTIDSTMRGIWYGAHLQIPQRAVETIQGNSGLTGYIVEDMQGRAAVEVWGATSAPVFLKINPRGGDNGILVEDGGLPLPISDRTPAIVVHLHATAPNMAAARALAASLDSEKILADFAPEIRGNASNFLPSTQLSAVPDLLAGDASDVIELRSGQRLRGTVQEKSMPVRGVLGELKIPIENVLGIITGNDPDRDCTLVTRGGDELRGRLEMSSLHLREADGAVADVPESEITRVGMHAVNSADTPPGDSTVAATTKPSDQAWFSTAGGDRMAIEMPATAIEIKTRCGTLKLNPDQIAEIKFCSPHQDDHQVLLTDGSRISGILSESGLTLKPRIDAVAALTIPVASLAVLHCQSPAIPQALKPQLKLVGDDVLVGSLTGDIAMETSFDTITIHTAELTTLSPLPPSHGSVAAVLSDGVNIRGRLASSEVNCTTLSGVSVQVPLMLLAGYIQPQPVVTEAQSDAILRLVAQLSGDDWKDRERAQAKLVEMGPVVADLLRKLQPTQAPEGQQRITAVLLALENESKP